MYRVVLTIATYCCILFSALRITTTAVSAAARDITPDSVLAAVNQTRRENGLPILLMNQKLVTAAENKAKNMQTYGYWAHTNPTTNETGWMFIQQSGYVYANAGENLARDYTSTQGIINGWLNSSTHKSVLLSAKYAETGIGVLYYTQNGVEKALVVQLFAKPLTTRQTVTTAVSRAFAGFIRTITL